MLPIPHARSAVPKPQESARFYITRRLLGVAVLILFVFGGAPDVAMRLLKPASRAPMPMEPPPLGWTTDGASLAPPVIHALFIGALPPPDPRQRKAPCDTEAEAEINGVCWVELAARPPKCPKGRAWSHTDGKCYAPVLRAEPVPTTGQPFPVTVAGEPE